MPTELYLIRHGESVANVEPVIGGRRGDAGLTERGRRQAELLGMRLAREQFSADVLYASTLPRAWQTARYVAQALDLPVVEADDLHELRPGKADGLSIEEWSATYPGLIDGPFTRPFQPFAPDGESWATFLGRAGGELTRLVTTHQGERVVAVTHGGVIEACFYLAFGLGPTTAPVAFAPANASITHWRHDTAEGRPAWTLITFNDAHHLDDSVSGRSTRQAVPTPAESRRS